MIPWYSYTCTHYLILRLCNLFFFGFFFCGFFAFHFLGKKFVPPPTTCCHWATPLRKNLEYVNPCNIILYFGGSLSWFILLFLTFDFVYIVGRERREDWINILDKKINITTIIWITEGISIILWFHSTSMICTSHVRIEIFRKGVVHSYVDLVAHLHYLVRTSKERSRD